MSGDYRVNKRLDHQVRAIATKVKADYKADGHYPVNVIRCLNSGTILTEFGRKNLAFKVVEDSELGEDDGRTEIIADVVHITVKRSVYQKAELGDGRARMTLAHELAHGVMHPGAPKFRGTGESGTTILSRLQATVSAEHQAKVFAAAFLIDDKTAAQIGIAEEVSVFFLVSLEAARICLDRLAREAEHAESAQRVQKLSEKIQSELAGKVEKEIRYVPDVLCTYCGKPTLISLGMKYLCCTCGRASDQFPDGDGPTV